MSDLPSSPRLPAEDVNWFCLRSQPKHEHIGAGHLRTMEGIEVFLPRIRFQRPTRQGTVWVTEALFPGYLFARFHWQSSFRQVQHARGIRGVVHFGERWPTIEAGVIEDLRQLVGTAEVREVSARLAPGDEVQIASGAFRGLHAVVSQVMPGKDRVAVLMELLGRQTCIHVSASQLIKPGDERTKFF
jgi:transcriptional antiterminator RfaH